MARNIGKNATTTKAAGSFAQQSKTATPPAHVASLAPLERNPVHALDLDWAMDVNINTSRVQKRAGEFGTRRSVKKDQQALWLLAVIACMDLTTLSGDDTKGKVDRLCAKSVSPLTNDIKDGLKKKLGHMVAGSVIDNLTTGAVCVYHNQVKNAFNAVGGKVPVAAVSTGFPDGQTPFETRLEEIKRSVADGATEIDIVITREHVLTGNWEQLYDEIRQCREVCGDAHMKTILETGNLGTLENIAKASRIAMMAGSDFIKTSTGKAPVNANIPVSLVMLRQIREFHEKTGIKIGFKPAGGISKAKDAVTYLSMVKEELGEEWLRPDLFRFGASSLLNDVERQLSHFVTGRYARAERMPQA